MDGRIGLISTVLNPVARHPTSVRQSRRSVIYRALADLPDFKDYVPVVFKIFSPDLQRKAFFNEILGYRIARLFELPVPADVRVCACPRHILPPASKALNQRRDSDLQSDEQLQFIPGLASVDATPKVLQQLLKDRASSVLQAELQGWERLPEVAVLDELLINIDRTISNLCRVAPGQFIPIDHEQILGGPKWNIHTLKKLSNAPSYANHIASFISDHTPKSTQDRMMEIAVHHARHLHLDEQTLEIEYAQMDSLCLLGKGSTRQVIGLLNGRCKKLPELLFHHLRYGQLFQ